MNRQASTLYPELFRSFIEKRTASILDKVRGSESALTTKMQQDVICALDYALLLPEAWSLARDLLLSTAPDMEQAGHRHFWLRYLQEGLQLSYKYNDNCAIAGIAFQIGYISQLLGELDEARNLFEESASYYFSSNQRIEYAQALNRQAYVARLQRRHNDAEVLVQQAMNVLGDNDPELQLSYFVLGIIAIDGKDGPTAESYFQQSLDLCKKQGNLRLVAQRLGNLGLAAYIQLDYVRAESFYKQSVTLFGELNDPVQQAQMRMNLGNVYLDANSPQSAIDMYDLAFSVVQKVHDRLYLAMLATNRGIAYGRVKQWQKAEQSLLNAINQWQAFANRRSESNATMELALVYLAKGERHGSIMLFDKALSILETIPDDPGYKSLHDAICAHRRRVLSLSEPKFDLHL